MRSKIEKVNSLGKLLVSSSSKDEILDMAMTITQDVLGYDHAIIRILDDFGYLHAVKWIGFPSEAADIEIRLGEGICGLVAQSGVFILVEDTTKDPRFLRGMDNCRSELCIPMSFHGKVIGVFNAESDTPAFFTQEDRIILENFASLITTSLEAARLREKLGKNEKLSMIGSFASSIMHDMRNDIHTLNICADLLESSPADPVRAEMVARKIRKSSKSIQGLVADIFEFVNTGNNTLNLEKVELGPFLENLALQVMAAAPAEVRISLETGEGLEIIADERRLARLLLNLSNNAMEAMPEGGVLTIKSAELDGAAIIEVEDTGTGIERDRLERIWEPFYTYGKSKGTGLGMSIVKKIIEDHGWRVQAESRVGKGTRFRIVIDKK